MQKNELIYKRVEELQLNTKNPRINDHAVDAVAKSIEKYGFKAPLIIDTNNIVYCGNTRLKAARKLGLEEVPCIVVTDLTPKQIREYALLDNKTNEIADWDLELLAEELKDLSLEEFELDWGIAELESEKEVVEDNCDIEEKLQEEPICKKGEIWRLGNHRLMCGDSTNKEDVQKLMKGEQADLIVTDPPYNVDYEGKTKEKLKIVNDKKESSAFFALLVDAFKNMEECLKVGGVFYIWYASREHINFEQALQAVGLSVKEQLIWKKNHFTFGRQDYHWKHEPCLYGWKEGAKHYFLEDRTQSTVLEQEKLELTKLKKEEMLELLQKIYRLQTTVLEEDKPLINALHPTMKPVRLLARLIENSSREEEIVLDLFVGSGSSIIACEQLNRKCYAMDLDEQYASVTIKRWEEFTGRKAVKENDG